MSRMTLTHADEHFAGAGQAGGLNQSIRGIGVQLVHRLIITDPIAGDVDGIILPGGSGTTPGIGAITPLDGTFVDSDGVGQLDFARNISAVSTAADTTQTLTITGRDIAGNPLVEDLAMNGTTEVVTASAFSSVSAVSTDLAFAGNLSLGTSVTSANIEFGLDARLLNGYDVLHAIDGLGAAEGGVFTVADVTDPPTASTGDARGTYNPSADPDGAEDYILYYIADFTKEGYGVNFSG